MLSPKEFIEDAIQKIKDQIGDEKAIIALSGGVDSSVCSVLAQKAVGDPGVFDGTQDGGQFPHNILAGTVHTVVGHRSSLLC